MSETVERTEVLQPGPAQALGSLLDVPVPDLAAGESLPPLWHWIYLLDRPAQADLGGRPGPGARPAPGRRGGDPAYVGARDGGEGRSIRQAHLPQRGTRDPAAGIGGRAGAAGHRLSRRGGADRDYAHDVESYPGLVTHGPLQALVMAEAARAQGAESPGLLFDYRLVSPLHDHQGLVTKATPEGDGLATYVRDLSGRTTAQGRVTTT